MFIIAFIILPLNMDSLITQQLSHLSECIILFTRNQSLGLLHWLPTFLKEKVKRIKEYPLSIILKYQSNTISDWKIYFPLKNKFIGELDNERKVNKYPRFVIVPKDEYIKRYPDWHKDRKNSSSATNYKLINERDDSLSIINKSSSINSPQRVIIEKSENRKLKQKFENNKNHDTYLTKDEFKRAKKMRNSLRNKTRDKRNRVFDPLIKRKCEHAKAFGKKNSLAVDRKYNDTKTTYVGLNKRREKSIRSKNDHNYIWSGYGDVLKLIKKKARIHSAHPQIK